MHTQFILIIFVQNFNTQFKMKLQTDNINNEIGKHFFPGKQTVESKLFAEILTQIQANEHVYYIEFYNTVPQKLQISKDAYRRAMAKIKKAGLIGKKGFCITLNDKEFSNKLKELTFIQK